MLLEFYTSDNLTLLRNGGAVTGDSTLLAKKFFNSKLLPGKNRDVIVISILLKEHLSIPEFQAIYYHEEGHYVMGHNKSSLISQNKKELQADLYAANKVGARVVLSALQKLPEALKLCEALRKEAMLTQTEEAYKKKLNLFLEDNDKKMKFRYDALKLRF